MATYAELYTLSSDPTLIAKVTTAIAVAAETIRTEEVTVPNHTARVQWALRALFNPDGEARKIMWVLMAQNKTQSVATISAASDTAIQTAVDSAIDLFIQ